MKSEIHIYISKINSEQKADSHAKLREAVSRYLQEMQTPAEAAEHTSASLSADFSACSAPDSWILAASEHGKPYFPEAPWLHFSISHSGDLWACAIADRPVGLDLQLRRKKSGDKNGQHSLRIAERFFHPDEKACLRCGGDFYDIWAAKESYVKYTGLGIAEGFDTFAVADENGILPRVRKNGDGPALCLISQQELEDYSMCLCAEAGTGEFPNVFIKTLDAQPDL